MIQKSTDQFSKKTTIIWLVLLLLIAGRSEAVDLTDHLSFHGYFGLDLTVVDNDIQAPGNAPRNFRFLKNKPTFNNSILGAQIRYEWSEKLSAFMQGSLSSDDQGSTHADLDWAYLSYDFGNDVDARVGRFQIPLLSGIELRKIGYTRLWARPLVPGNGASGNIDYTGLDVIKHAYSGENHWIFQAGGGKGRHGNDTVHNKNVKYIAAKLERDKFWLRVAVLGADFEVRPVNRMVGNDGSSVLASVESEINLGNFQINTGYSDSQAEIVPDDKMAYLSLGYHFEKWTPFVVGVRLNQHFDPLPRGNPPGSNNGPVGPPLNLRVGDRNGYNLGLGVRFEIRNGLATKVQFDRNKDKDQTNRLNGVINTKGNIFTLTLEGVF